MIQKPFECSLCSQPEEILFGQWKCSRPPPKGLASEYRPKLTNFCEWMTFLFRCLFLWKTWDSPGFHPIAGSQSLPLPHINESFIILLIPWNLWNEFLLLFCISAHILERWKLAIVWVSNAIHRLMRTVHRHPVICEPKSLPFIFVLLFPWNHPLHRFCRIPQVALSLPKRLSFSFISLWKDSPRDSLCHTVYTAPFGLLAIVRFVNFRCRQIVFHRRSQSQYSCAPQGESRCPSSAPQFPLFLPPM